ncbi:hypothetical protein F5Y17DRAFT_451638 [Xylariaceae sp. FL0594]|nr:hypothetical protein F5Y17DRAFT_451638 [Xylariaceae sp. FL0594]
MLRPTQQLCRRACTWSSICETQSSKCLRPSATTRISRQISRQRQFSTCRPLAELTKPLPREEPSGRPIDAVAVTLPADLAEPESTSQIPKPEPQQQQQERQQRRRRRRIPYVTAAVFLLLGTTAGTLFRLTVAPPALPVPGSDEDAYMESAIRAKGAALPLVQQLSSDPAWTSWDAYEGISRTTPNQNQNETSGTTTSTQNISAAQSRITSGPMSGSSGLAFQRIFHNASTGEVVTVVYLGAGLAGWPGVVHGGALATLLDESLGRCAILRFPSRTGVTANLELRYRRPTLTNNFYVLRTRPLDADESGGQKSDRKLWVKGTLETENGKTCVEAKGLFVVPRGYQLRPLVEGF